MEVIIIYIIIALLTLYVLKTTVFAAPKTTDPLNTGAIGSSNPSRDKKSQPILEGKFTPRTLYKFNGFDDPKIYIAVRGKVYDVSRARQFYGPSGPYSNFAGHDASRGLALNSFDMEVITPLGEPIDTLEGLSAAEWDSLNGWQEMFAGKYTCVGVLVNEDEL